MPMSTPISNDNRDLLWVRIDMISVLPCCSSSTSICISPNNPTVYQIEKAIMRLDQGKIEKPIVRVSRISVLVPDEIVFIDECEKFMSWFFDLLSGFYDKRRDPTDRIAVLLDSVYYFLTENDALISNILETKIGA